MDTRNYVVPRAATTLLEIPIPPGNRGGMQGTLQHISGGLHIRTSMKPKLQDERPEEIPNGIQIMVQGKKNPEKIDMTTGHHHGCRGRLQCTMASTLPHDSTIFK